MSQSVKKVVLAYSGGLDTSIILKWLQATYGCAYDHRDAAGFIRLNALRLRTLGQRKKKLGL